MKKIKLTRANKSITLKALAPYYYQQLHAAVGNEPEFSFPKKTKNPNPSPIEKRFGFSLFGATGRIRTSGLPGRSRTLYPAELRSHDLY